ADGVATEGNWGLGRGGRPDEDRVDRLDVQAAQDLPIDRAKPRAGVDLSNHADTLRYGEVVPPQDLTARLVDTDQQFDDRPVSNQRAGQVGHGRMIREDTRTSSVSLILRTRKASFPQR